MNPPADGRIFQVGQGDVVRFRCEGCGLKIRVPAEHAGKKAKCPKCKTLLHIPRLFSKAAGEIADTREDVIKAMASNGFDSAFLDLPKKT